MAGGEDQRPNGRIQDDVSERLAAELRSDATQIQVTVTDGDARDPRAPEPGHARFRSLLAHDC